MERKEPDFWMEEMPQLVALLRRSRVAAAEGGKEKAATLRQVAEMLEPSYESFYCPLSKRVMEDPVSIANGATYERRAIANWFRKKGPVCPATREELGSTEVAGNLALQSTISGWKKRNEQARVKLACVALSIGSSTSQTLEAMRDLPRLCSRHDANMDLAAELGAVRLLGQFLQHPETKIRCEALKSLTFFARDEPGKEKVLGTKQIENVTRLLSSEEETEVDLAVSFLLELSRSVDICRKMALVSGTILMLVNLKFNKLLHASLTEKVTKTLENLEKSPANIKLMAEEGYLDPLLKNLVQGTEGTKLEMARLLGKLELPHHTKAHVSSPAIATLLRMVKDPDPEVQVTALRALARISSHPSNAAVLVASGAVPLVVEPFFASSSHHHRSSFLADILDNLSGEPESLQIDSQGRTMVSDYAIWSLVYMLQPLNGSNLNLELNVVRILLSLAAAESKKPADRIARAMEEAEKIPAVVQFISSDDEKLAIASLKLLLKLTPILGGVISEKLCKAEGQPGGILAGLRPARSPTEKQVASAELLAKLPHDGPSLNKALLRGGAISSVLTSVEELQSNGRAATSRNGKLLLEGLVGTLVRFTATAEEAEIRNALVEKDMATVFTNLLGSSTEEVLRLSAVGLRNLSVASPGLSHPVEKKEKKKKKRYGLFFCCIGHTDDSSSEEEEEEGCSVHGGVCSPATFCLVKTGAAERLLGCLEHDSDLVVEAALEAVQTLMEGKVNAANGLRRIEASGGVAAVVRLVKEERGEEVRRRALSVIQKFLANGDGMLVNELRSDTALCSFLLTRMRHGDGGDVRLMCEDILRSLNRMPKHTSV